jgi:hypothetical protein
VHVPEEYLDLFRNHRHHFDVLADPQVSITRKRDLITQQRGGFLPLVVPLIATVLGSLGAEFISRAFRGGGGNDQPNGQKGSGRRRRA